MKTAHATDVGHRRSVNEDAFLDDTNERLFVVADGLGGHPAGDVASQLTVDFLADRLRGRTDGAELLDLLRETLVDANRMVASEASEDADKRGMGTTAVIAHLSDDERLLTLAHVGDSRAYLLRDGELRRATEDHVMDSAFGRTLTQAIGSSDDVNPEAAEIALEPGDRILLCTDGLTDMVSDRDIGEVLRSDCQPEDCCDELISMALERGGHDNVTLIVIDPQPSD